jgi:hypothetical protein
MPKIFLTALASLLLSGYAFAAGGCNTLKTCAKIVTDLTGEVYIWDDAAEGAKFYSSQELDFTKDNAAVLFTTLLDQAGLARLPIGDRKTYRIVRMTTMKETTTPVVEASADRAPTLPKTWDWVTMRYKTKSPEEPSFIEQSYRLHVPREARMQADDNTGTLIVTGAAPMVAHMYEMIKAADKPLSPLAKQSQKKYEERQNKSK